MIRAPSYLDDNTSTFARTCPGFGKTQAQMALAIEVYRTPLWKRIVWAFCRHGWATVPALLAVLVLTGCEEIDSQERTAASLRDALAQAQKDRPELWTAEHKKRADVAVGIVAKGDQ